MYEFPVGCISAQTGYIGLAMLYTELQIKSKHLKGGTLNSNYILHFRQQHAINVKPHGMRDIIVLFACVVCNKEIWNVKRCQKKMTVQTTW